METLPALMQAELWYVLFINHTAMLILSIVIMLAISRGKLSRYGFKLADSTHLGQALLWGLALGMASTLLQASLPGEGTYVEGELSLLQRAVFIWFYASISEEVFARGLIQGSLARWTQHGVTVFGTRISLPVLASAILFGLLHLVQSAMGAGAYQVIVVVVFAFALGILAGYQRERTGSLVPAIVVHAFANVGGSLASCLMG